MGWLDDVGNNVTNNFNQSMNQLGIGGGNQSTLDRLGRAYTTVVGGEIAGIPGLVAGKKIGDAITNSPTEPKAPGVDPTLQSIKQQQVDDAKKFRANLGQTQQGLYETAYKTERGNLAANIQAARNNANSRGLLYSGIEQGNELGARRFAAGNLAQARTEINNSTEDQARQLEANAVQTGIMQQHALAQIHDESMSQALNNMAARRQALTGVGQAGGAIAGTMLANQYSAAPSRAAPTSYGSGNPQQPQAVTYVSHFGAVPTYRT